MIGSQINSILRMILSLFTQISLMIFRLTDFYYSFFFCFSHKFMSRFSYYFVPNKLTKARYGNISDIATIINLIIDKVSYTNWWHLAALELSETPQHLYLIQLFYYRKLTCRLWVWSQLPIEKSWWTWCTRFGRKRTLWWCLHQAKSLDSLRSFCHFSPRYSNSSFVHCVANIFKCTPNLLIFRILWLSSHRHRCGYSS
jgi:uncharacterized membrane protein